MASNASRIGARTKRPIPSVRGNRQRYTIRICRGNGHLCFLLPAGECANCYDLEFSGQPYPVLEAGDVMRVGVIGATSGDTFTVGAYVNEIPSPATTAALSNANQSSAGYIPRAGTRRWG